MKRLVLPFRRIPGSVSRVPAAPSRILKAPPLLCGQRQAGETTMKSSLLLVGLLLIATSAHAQHHHSPAMGGGNSSGLGNNWGNGGGGWGSDSFGSRSRPMRYEAPQDYSVEYARNDGPFIPSTYMNYED